MNNWKTVNLFEISDNAPKSFVDGDWIESPYITNKGVRLIQTGNIGIGYFKNKNKTYISHESFKALNCNEVFAGDILICRLAEPIGRSCIVPDIEEKYITSVDVCILRVGDNYSKEYINQYLNTDFFLKRAELLSGGSTRQRISRTNLGKIPIKVPELSQQQKIAKILSTCDTVIGQTEQAIKKYQAIKQGMMIDLFTRGIDINTGKLRPSYEQQPDLYKESELGWIPKDWEAKKLSDISKINQGLQIAISNRFQEGGDNRYLYITIQYLNNIGSPAYEYFIANPLDRVICTKDDILMVRTGNTGQIVSNIEGAFHNNFFKIVYDDSVLKDYLIYHLKREVIQNLIMNYAGTTTIPDLKHRDFYKLPIGLPPLSEQSLIVNKIQAVDTKIQSEKDTLNKYQQIKAGLMQDLLTGKVQVQTEGVA